MMGHDMNVQTHVQIVLLYLQPEHLGDQSHLVVCLDHHLLSPQIIFVLYVYIDACLLSMIHSALVNS